MVQDEEARQGGEDMEKYPKVPRQWPQNERSETGVCGATGGHNKTDSQDDCSDYVHDVIHNQQFKEGVDVSNPPEVGRPAQAEREDAVEKNQEPDSLGPEGPDVAAKPQQEKAQENSCS